MSREVRNL